MVFLRRLRGSRAALKFKSRVRQYTRDDALHERAKQLEASVRALQDAVRVLSGRLDSVGAALEQIPVTYARPADLDAPKSRIADLETAVAQLTLQLRRETGLTPPPPKHLQERVVGAYVAGFLESGFSICRDLDASLAAAGKKLADFPRILDWGCGSGRVTRAMRLLLPDAQLSGTDIDPEAIAWLQANCAGVADFRVAPHRPPTSYPDASFDFILGLSVFTHLPEDMQFEWLSELRRIAAPDAHLILTTSGEKNYSQLDEPTRAIMASKGFFYWDGVNYGRSISLPDFYQNTWHSIAYVRREWSKFFDVVDVRPEGLQGLQDAVLLRRAS